MLNKLQNDPVTNSSYKNQWRPAIIFSLLAIMMASVFFSRILLSATMIVFVVFSILHKQIKKQVFVFLSSPLLWSMSLLFFLPLISGLWSGDKNEWLEAIKIKAPLIVMPFAFAAPFRLSKKQWQRLAFLFVAFVVIATVWSMGHYILEAKEVNENYLRSQLLIVPLENDHVRFSWMIAVSILVSVWLWFEKKKESKMSNWLLLLFIIWQIIFLHILAARTGLLTFYAMTLLAAIGFIVKKWRSGTGIILLLILLVLPIVAFFSLPTFQNRVKYFLYDLPYFSKGHYSPTMNDAVRIISLKAGWNVMKEHSFSGVGFGDVLDETKKWYANNYPNMKEVDKILPSSEWLIYGDGCGWPGMILLGLVVIIPFFIPVKKSKWLWILLNASVLLSLLFDIGLEIQFGVFLYSFVVLWWWKQAIE
ncbi:MAG TPA: O-antigen ligase family protein [Chitinophagaceae bacterium]|nr:O-antigen ligase family protein [Chitinophagaceae bacterium]